MEADQQREIQSIKPGFAGILFIVSRPEHNQAVYTLILKYWPYPIIKVQYKTYYLPCEKLQFVKDMLSILLKKTLSYSRC